LEAKNKRTYPLPGHYCHCACCLHSTPGLNMFPRTRLLAVGKAGTPPSPPSPPFTTATKHTHYVALWHQSCEWLLDKPVAPIPSPRQSVRLALAPSLPLPCTIDLSPNPPRSSSKLPRCQMHVGFSRKVTPTNSTRIAQKVASR
jgi:hypothetical protein